MSLNRQSEEIIRIDMYECFNVTDNLVFDNPWMNESVLIVSESCLTQSVAAKKEEPGDIFPREMILRKCLQ